MIVRCGACRNQFDVPGPGRFACPVCGSVNVVRAAAERPGSGPAGPYTPPPSPPPDPPSPRVTCPQCSFRFIVGNIELAKCPNCGSEVKVEAQESA